MPNTPSYISLATATDMVYAVGAMTREDCERAVKSLPLKPVGKRFRPHINDVKALIANLRQRPQTMAKDIKITATNRRSRNRGEWQDRFDY